MFIIIISLNNDRFVNILCKKKKKNALYIFSLICYRPSSVKLRVNELESSDCNHSVGVSNTANSNNSTITIGCTSSPDRKSIVDPRRNLVLNLTTQFEGVAATSSAANSPSDDILVKPLPMESPKFNRIAVIKPPVVTTMVTANVCQKRDIGDLFSSRLDRVFEREERKQSRDPDPLISVGSGAGNGGDVSRQNSWSSYDSAVVLRDVISRHSSWGSCDTRTLPSRNSSWGSYDVRPIMQYVSERGERPVTESSAVAVTTASSTVMKAPSEVSYHMVKRPKQKDQQQKLLLPNCYSSSPTLGQGTSPKYVNRATASQPNISGLGGNSSANAKQCNSMVKSLKEEFEAKASDTVEKLPRKNISGVSCGGGGSGNGSGSGGTTDDDVGISSEHVKSLPTSPVSEHPLTMTQRPSPAASMEDISVRKLVGKYENGRARSKTFVLDSGCPRGPQHYQQQPPVPPRVSSLDAAIIGPRKFTKFECNPVVKTVVLPIQQSDIRASVNRAANNKLQQGKSHPLTKLSFKQLKVNSTVYNSM